MPIALDIRRWATHLIATSGVRLSRRDPLGRRGEREAARLLRRSRYRILGRNLRVPMGEADLLALAPDRLTVVLVEVKSRRTADGPSANPPPEASIHLRKRAKLNSILRHLARANNWHDRPLRIDVVAVEFPSRGRPTLRHHVGAVISER